MDCFSPQGFWENFACSLPRAATDGGSLWLIILLPLIGAFLCGVFGKLLGRQNTYLIACGSVFGSFLLSVMVFITLNEQHTTLINPFGEAVRYAMAHDYGVWFSAGSFRVDFGLFADHLSGSMLLVITGIGFLIHL